MFCKVPPFSISNKKVYAGAACRENGSLKKWDELKYCAVQGKISDCLVGICAGSVNDGPCAVSVMIMQLMWEFPLKSRVKS